MITRHILFPGMFLLLISCNKDAYFEPSGSSVDIYYLEDYRNVENSFEIIDSTVVLSEHKIVEYSEIISYSSVDYTFTLCDSASERLDDISFHGIPFALTLDREIIYTGYFWTAFSSSGCDWITIEPLDFSGKNELTVRLGYPGIVEGDIIPDRRNDTGLLRVLKQDGKLKDDPR